MRQVPTRASSPMATTVDITSTDVKAVIAKTQLSDTSEASPCLARSWSVCNGQSRRSRRPSSVGRALWTEAALTENVCGALGSQHPTGLLRQRDELTAGLHPEVGSPEGPNNGVRTWPIVSGRMPPRRTWSKAASALAATGGNIPPGGPL